MMRKYSVGVFFDIWKNDKKDWIRKSNFIKKLSGIEHVEVMLEYVDITQRDISIIKKLLEPYRVILHAPFMNLSILSPHREIVQASLEVYKKAGKIGKQLGADTMTFHIETYPNFYTEKEVQSRTKNLISELSNITNMKIGIENISYGGNTRISYPSSPDQLYKLSKILPLNVGFTLDVGHFLSDEFDPIAVIDKLKHRILDIHLHDGISKKAHLGLGKGNLNLKQLIDALEISKYSGFLTLEVLGAEEISRSWNILKKLI